MIPFDQIASVALANSHRLVPDWLPAGRKRGHEYVVGGLNGQPGDSMSVNLNTGKWADFAGEAKGGDLISLYAAIHCNGDQGRAARELSNQLGVQTDSRDPAPPPRAVDPQSDWQSSRPPEDAPPPPISGYDHVYTYCDEVEQPIGYVLRNDATATEKKKILPLTWGRLKDPKTGAVKVGWHFKQPATPRPLYGLDRLYGRSNVIVCEGEKAADAAQRMFPKIACVTWMAGTGNVAKNDWSAVEGKSVIIWPDNDEPGHKAASELRDILSCIAASVRMLNVDDMPHGFDAADLDTDSPSDWARERMGPVLGGRGRAPIDKPGPVVKTERRSAGLDPISVRAGEIDVTASLGEAALINSGLPIYQRGASLVRPARMEVIACGGRVTTAAGLTEITPPAMIDMLSQAVEWQKWDKRLNEYKPIDPTPAVGAVILSRIGQWRFQPVAGVITAPTLRQDGSVLDAPGYDATTRLYHVDDPTLGINLPKPTREAAEVASKELSELITAFPFVGEVDRSVAMAALITPVVRGAMPVSPMFAIRANTPGSGKSYFVDLVSHISSGRPCPVVTAGEDDAETDKRLVGMLLASYPIISIDNCNGELGTDLLNQAIERPLISLRELGKSTITEIENRSTLFATGNSLRVKGDMTRRTLIVSLDAGMERPELRSFETAPHEMILADRGRYISHAITIVRAYLASGEKLNLPPFASFEGWSNTVRAAIVWLGYPDPCTTMEDAREDDPELTEIRMLMAVWEKHIGFHVEKTLREVDEISQRANPSGSLVAEDLREALLAIAPKGIGQVNTRWLGKWMMSKAGRIADGRRFLKGKLKDGVVKWKLAPVQVE